MIKKNKLNKSQRNKVIIIGVFFCLFYSAIVFRSYQLQILGNAKVSKLAKAQHRTQLVTSPQRGSIYDRNGEILALDVVVASIGVHPGLIQDKEKTIKILAAHAGVSKNKIVAKLNSKRKFEWIQRRIPLEQGEAIEKEKINGIQVLKEYRRFYPNKEMAGQLLGAVGYDAKALGGLELSYDSFLRSATVKKKVERDARGRLFSTPNEKLDIHHLYLTIDKNIQTFAEKALVSTAKKHDVKSGFAIVLDVETGEVLAMANYPQFNPNAYWKYSQRYWKNHAVLDVYEPGSTFKPFLMAVALDNKIVKPKDKIFCENGRYKIGPDVVNDHDPYGWLNAQEIIKVSSNIGITKIAQKLGRKNFYNFLHDLGFGQKLDIGIGGESSGVMRPYKQWHEIDLSNISFGQGISVNGLQMVAAYTALAKGGELIKPYLIKEVVDASGSSVIQNHQREGSSVVDYKTANDLKEMLHLVTLPGGTAIQANVPGYLSAGKTGTAQKFDSKIGQYAHHEYVSSFIGFSPLKDPKILVYVVYDVPRKNGYYGGVVAGPVFKEIVERSLKYLNVVPEKKNQEINLAQSEKVEEKIENVGQDFVAAKKALQEKKMPDLQGMSLRRILQLTEYLGVELTIKGNGVVVSQKPQTGMPLLANEKWFLELKERS